MGSDLGTHYLKGRSSLTIFFNTHIKKKFKKIRLDKKYLFLSRIMNEIRLFEF